MNEFRTTWQGVGHGAADDGHAGGRAAIDRTDLLAPPVVSALRGFAGADGVFVAPIDPDLADTAAFCAAYDVPPAASANCVVVTGKRAGEQRWAAAVVLATTRADVNGVVRRRMDVRKVSFARDGGRRSS